MSAQPAPCGCGEEGLSDITAAVAELFSGSEFEDELRARGRVRVTLNRQTPKIDTRAPWSPDTYPMETQHAG